MEVRGMLEYKNFQAVDILFSFLAAVVRGESAFLQSRSAWRSKHAHQAVSTLRKARGSEMATTDVLLDV